MKIPDVESIIMKGFTDMHLNLTRAGEWDKIVEERIKDPVRIVRT